MNSNKTIIGRKILVGLPDLHLHGIEAKVDTGAYTSSLHCKLIKTFHKGNKPYVAFYVFDNEKLMSEEVSCHIYSQKIVKSSNGQKENRYTILTTLQIGEKSFEAEFTLTDRSEMRSSILIGRKVLAGRFLIDVSKTCKRSKN